MNPFNIDIIYAFPIAIGLFFLTFTIIIRQLFKLNFRIKRIYNQTIADLISNNDRCDKIIKFIDKIDSKIEDFKFSFAKIIDEVEDSNSSLNNLDRLLLKKPVMLKFTTTKSTVAGLEEISIPVIHIFDGLGTAPLLKTCSIWDTFKFVIENDYYVTKDNIDEVLHDYNSWKNKSME